MACNCAQVKSTCVGNPTCSTNSKFSLCESIYLTETCLVNHLTCHDTCYYRTDLHYNLHFYDSKILKRFIKVVFYANQLYVKFLQKKNTLGSIECINISNLFFRFFRLSGSLHTYFDVWLVKS